MQWVKNLNETIGCEKGKEHKFRPNCNLTP